MVSLERALKYQQMRDYGFNDREIRYFDLVNKSDDEICTYMPAYVYKHRVRNHINTQQRQVLSDKIAAQHMLGAIGCPMPKMIGVWDPTFGLTVDGRDMTTVSQLGAEIEDLLKDTKQVDLIFKPRDGGSGQHILAGTFSKDSDGAIVVRRKGETQSLADFVENLPKDARSIISGNESYGWIIQVKVEQHPELAGLNPSSLNTIRLMTFVEHSHSDDPGSNHVLLDFAGLRLGRAGSSSDNLGNGGFMIEVDLETGCLKRGRYAPEHSMETLEEHPDSHLRFVGFKIPYWEESVALCFRIAMAFPSVKSIGWDVAITEDGPLIIEGNCPWGTRLPQGFGTGYLTPDRRARLIRAGADLPPAQLPPKRALPGQSRLSWMLYKMRKKIDL